MAVGGPEFFPAAKHAALAFLLFFIFANSLAPSHPLCVCACAGWWLARCRMPACVCHWRLDADDGGASDYVRFFMTLQGPGCLASARRNLARIHFGHRVYDSHVAVLWTARQWTSAAWGSGAAGIMPPPRSWPCCAIKSAPCTAPCIWRKSASLAGGSLADHRPVYARHVAAQAFAESDRACSARLPEFYNCAKSGMFLLVSLLAHTHTNTACPEHALE